MEAIMIHPENAEQLTLPDHVMASIDRGIEQAAQGKTIGLDAFKEKHFLKR